MLALVLSVLLTVYLIVPEAIFRTVFGHFIPPKNFVLTRSETAYRAALIAFLPFFAALFCAWEIPGMRYAPFSVRNNSVELRRADYKIVAEGLYSDSEFKSSKAEFWPAFTRSLRRQARFAIWYMLLIVLEAYLVGLAASKYSSWRKYSVYRFLTDRLLFPFLSEWLPLLTPYNQLLPNTVVQADILCTNETLYQGIVAQHFAEEGKLSGIILHGPKRFDRQNYLKRKEEGQEPQKKDFWITIPSENLYFFADKIVNMNLTYISPDSAISDTPTLKNYIISTLGLDPKVGKITISIKPAKQPPQ